MFLSYACKVYQRVPVHQRNLSIDTNQFTNSDQQVLVHTSNLATQLQVSTNQVIYFIYIYMYTHNVYKQIK